MGYLYTHVYYTLYKVREVRIEEPFFDLIYSTLIKKRYISISSILFL